MKTKNKYYIMVASLMLAICTTTVARDKILYPTKLEIRKDYQFLAQSKENTEIICEGNWNLAADKMASVDLRCESAPSVRVSLTELQRNGWALKNQTLAPHVTTYAPEGVPGWKRLNVVIIKVKPMPHYTDSYNNRYALPGEQNPG